MCMGHYHSSSWLKVRVRFLVWNVVGGSLILSHSSPLCHALSSSSLLWTSMRRWRVTVATPGEWQCGVRRLAVANGPHIFQMLLVIINNNWLKELSFIGSYSGWTWIFQISVGFCWPLCVFMNYVYLLTNRLLFQHEMTDQKHHSLVFDCHKVFYTDNEQDIHIP